MKGTSRLLLLLGLTALGPMSPSITAAQTSVFVGGAAAIPIADFGEVADLGIQGSLGGTVDVGMTGFALRATGFFGSYPHSIAGERSDLYGATVLAGYTVAEAYELRFRVWAGVGGTVHARKSDRFPGLDASRRGLTVSGGASVSRPVGRVNVFASGLYTRGLGDLGTSSYPTEFVTIGGGVSIPLSLD